MVTQRRFSSPNWRHSRAPEASVTVAPTSVHEPSSVAPTPGRRDVLDVFVATLFHCADEPFFVHLYEILATIRVAPMCVQRDPAITGLSSALVDKEPLDNATMVTRIRIVRRRIGLGGY